MAAPINYSIALRANWNGNGTFTANNSTVTFNGTSAQSINMIGLSFYNLQIDNAANVTITEQVSVTNQVTLTNGRLVLGNNNLVLSPGASIAGASSTRFIQTGGGGKLRLSLGSGSLGGSVTFPIGENTTYSPITVTFNAGTSTSAVLGANVIRAALTGVINAAINRFWNVDMEGGSFSSLSYTISYRYEDGDLVLGGTNEVDWEPVKKDGAAVVYGGTSALDEATNTVTWAGLTSFSSFSVASPSVPLPITLESFEGWRR